MAVKAGEIREKSQFKFLLERGWKLRAVTRNALPEGGSRETRRHIGLTRFCRYIFKISVSQTISHHYTRTHHTMTTIVSLFVLITMWQNASLTWRSKEIPYFVVSAQIGKIKGHTPRFEKIDVFNKKKLSKIIISTRTFFGSSLMEIHGIICRRLCEASFFHKNYIGNQRIKTDIVEKNVLSVMFHVFNLIGGGVKMFWGKISRGTQNSPYRVLATYRIGNQTHDDWKTNQFCTRNTTTVTKRSTHSSCALRQNPCTRSHVHTSSSTVTPGVRCRNRTRNRRFRATWENLQKRTRSRQPPLSYCVSTTVALSFSGVTCEPGWYDKTICLQHPLLKFISPSRGGFSFQALQTRHIQTSAV